MTSSPHNKSSFSFFFVAKNDSTAVQNPVEHTRLSDVAFVSRPMGAQLWRDARAPGFQMFFYHIVINV